MALDFRNKALYPVWLLVRGLELVLIIIALCLAIRALPEFMLPIILLTIAYYIYFHYTEIFGRSLPSRKLLMQADMLIKRGWRQESAVEWPYVLDILLSVGTGGPLIAVLLALPDVASTAYFISDLVRYAGIFLCCIASWVVAYVLWLRTTKRV